MEDQEQHFNTCPRPLLCPALLSPVASPGCGPRGVPGGRGPSPATQVSGPTERTKEMQAVGVRGWGEDALQAHSRIRGGEREPVNAFSFDIV